MTVEPMKATWVGPPVVRKISLALLLAFEVAWLWVLMLFLHEVGHCATALLTGGQITTTDLRPGIPGHTLVNPDPQPDLVVWGGFLSGCGVPALVWAVCVGLRLALRVEAQLLTGFCLLANGAYLAAGGSESLTDTGVLLQLGWSWPLLIVIGLGLAVPGYALLRHAFLQRLAGLRVRQNLWRSVLVRGLLFVLWVSLQAALTIQFHLAG